MATDVNKRVRFFDHQFLRARDLETEQAYHIDRNRRHTAGFHTAGIVSGLLVRMQDATHVTVDPGWAVADDGREMILPTGAGVANSELPALEVGQNDKIWLAPRERETDTSQDPGITHEATRVDETPLLLASTDNPGSGSVPANAVKLASLAGGTLKADDRTEVELRARHKIRSNDVELWDTSGNEPPTAGAGIKTRHIADDAVTTDKIGTAEVWSDNVAPADGGDDQTVSTGKGIKTGHLKDRAVTSPKIAAQTILSEHFAIAAGGTDQTPSSGTGIKTAHIKNFAVTGDKVADATLTLAKFAPGTVFPATIGADAITDVELRDHVSVDNMRAVTTNHIRNDAVTSDKLADHPTADGARAVTADHIRNDAVTADKLRDDPVVDGNRAVTTDHIRDKSVSLVKLLTTTGGAAPVLIAANQTHQFPLGTSEGMFLPQVQVTPAAPPVFPLVVGPGIIINLFLQSTTPRAEVVLVSTGTAMEIVVTNRSTALYAIGGFSRTIDVAANVRWAGKIVLLG
jgi:hypothetical protein